MRPRSSRVSRSPIRCPRARLRSVPPSSPRVFGRSRSRRASRRDGGARGRSRRSRPRSREETGAVGDAEGDSMTPKRVRRSADRGCSDAEPRRCTGLDDRPLARGRHGRRAFHRACSRGGVLPRSSVGGIGRRHQARLDRTPRSGEAGGSLPHLVFRCHVVALCRARFARIARNFQRRARSPCRPEPCEGALP